MGEQSTSAARCTYRDGSGRECHLRRESVIHKTDHADTEISAAAHAFQEDQAPARSPYEIDERDGVRRANRYSRGFGGDWRHIFEFGPLGAWLVVLTWRNYLPGESRWPRIFPLVPK